MINKEECMWWLRLAHFQGVPGNNLFKENEKYITILSSS